MKNYNNSECYENFDSDVFPIGLVFDFLGLFLVVSAACLHLLGFDYQQFDFFFPVHQLFQRVCHDLFHVVQVLSQGLVALGAIKPLFPYSSREDSAKVSEPSDSRHSP